MGTGGGLLRRFDLDPLGDGSFSISEPSIGNGRIFGGQVAAQSLLAACRTVPPDRVPHSLHAYFLRQGRTDRPLRFDVDRVRDGRSFSVRQVTAEQGGRPILEMLASFHVPEPGHEWQPPAPAVTPSPEDLPPPDPRPFAKHLSAFDVRAAPRTGPAAPGARHPFWIRLREPIGDDAALHASLIAYISDMGVVTGSRAPGSPPLAMAVSLDHAVWFHRPARVDEWLLFSAGPAGNSAARGLAKGAFHTAGGTLVASVAQEALLRPRPGA